MKTSGITSLLTLSASLVLFAASSLAQNFTAPYSTIVPTIDGTLTPAEWSDASSNTVAMVRNDGTGQHAAALYFKHDSQFLYVGVNSGWSSGWDVFWGLVFDGNHNHIVDGSLAEPRIDFDCHYPCPGGWSGLDRYIVNISSTNRQHVPQPSSVAHASAGSAPVTYEFRIPLSELGVAPGSTVGLAVAHGTDGTGPHAYCFPGLWTYDQPAQWANLLLMDNRVVLINPDRHRILKMAGQPNTTTFISLASGEAADGGGWVHPEKWSGVGTNDDFIASALRSAGYQVTCYEADAMPALTRNDCPVLIIQDPLRANLRNFSKECEYNLPDLLEHTTNSAFLSRVHSYFNTGGSLVLVGDAVRLLENGPGRLNFGKTVLAHSAVNSKSTVDPQVPDHWLFIRGNPFCCHQRSGSGQYDVVSSPFLLAGTRFADLTLVDNCDLPFALSWSDTVYYPADGNSLLDLRVHGAGQYVLVGSICSPPVYSDAVDDTFPHYMGSIVANGHIIYYIGSDSFFNYRYRDWEGTWHCGSYRQLQSTFSTAAKSALVGLVQKAASTAFDLNNGLLAHWPFDGTAEDASGNGHNGIIENASFAPDRFGNANQALHFNGVNASVRITAGVTTGQPFTWSFWFRPERSGTSSEQSLLGQGGVPGSGLTSPAVYLNSPAGQLRFWTYPPPSTDVKSFRRSEWHTSTWYHVAAVSDASGNRSLYVNGICEGTGVGMPFGVNLQNFYIGATPPWYANYFEGDIDEVRVYNRVLSPAEVQELVGYMPPNQPPVAHIAVSPLAQFPGVTNLVIISASGLNADVVLDGSQSSDPDRDSLAFTWMEGNSTLSTGMVDTNCLAIGRHEITLVVSDGKATASETVTMDVITLTQSVDIIMEMVERADLGKRNAQALYASLKAAGASFERGNLGAGGNQLRAFQGNVRSQVAPFDSNLSEQLTQATQLIINVVGDERARK